MTSPVSAPSPSCVGEQVDEILLKASLRENSTFAISVATQLGRSGIAYVIMKRMLSMMCYNQLKLNAHPFI